MKAVVLVSGGLDSSTLAYKAAFSAACVGVHLLSFDYGQRHKKEINFACRQWQDIVRNKPESFKTRFDVVNLSSLGRVLSGSALTDPSVEVPEGHYAEPSMKVTVVPNRNAIMLAVAFGVAVADGADVVAAAFHAGDHYIYPDCRPEFVAAFEQMQKIATAGFAHPRLTLWTPFIHQTKADIVREGYELGVDFINTWGCYMGGELHCGKCGTCVERILAFEEAGVADPTFYAGGKDYAFSLRGRHES